MHIACKGETELPGKFDVIRIDLQPSEQYKSVSTQTQHLIKVCIVYSCSAYQMYVVVVYLAYCHIVRIDGACRPAT